MHHSKIQVKAKTIPYSILIIILLLWNQLHPGSNTKARLESASTYNSCNLAHNQPVIQWPTALLYAALFGRILGRRYWPRSNCTIASGNGAWACLHTRPKADLYWPWTISAYIEESSPTRRLQYIILNLYNSFSSVDASFDATATSENLSGFPRKCRLWTL